MLDACFVRRPLLLPAFMAAAMTACTEPESQSGFGVSYVAGGAYADPALFRAEITQGSRRQVIDGSSLTMVSHSLNTMRAGVEGLRLFAGIPVTVRLSIVLAPGDTAAAGSVSWTPERNWSYGVTAELGAERPPHGFCVLSVEEVGPLPPRDGTSGVKLFIVRSGLQEGTVC